MRLSKNYGSDFRLPVPVPGAWTALPRQAAVMLVSRLSEFGIFDKGLRIAAARLLPLSFYDGWMLCDLETTSSDAETICGLYGPDGWTPLDGQSPRIHEHNAIHGVRLGTDTERLDYLRFFCAYIHGVDGPFNIVDGDTPLWRIEKSGLAPLEAEILEDPEWVDAPAGDTPTLDAFVLFGRALFRSQLALDPSGMVRMVDDQLICESVVMKPEIEYGAGTRKLFLGAPG